MDFFLNLLNTDSFPRRWECGVWTSPHGWLHILSDLATFTAYLAIPFVLLYYLRKRPDVPFPRIFYMFAAFIFACGTVHLIEAIIFWWPVYRLSGAFKLLTAIVSWGTVAEIFRCAPQALRMRTSEELEREIQHRKLVEVELLENQQRVIRAERLSAIGQAMTGLIHESRNALARSQAGLHLLSREVDSRDDLLELIDESLSAQQDLSDLFEVVRQYAVPPPLRRSATEISELVQETWERLSHATANRNASIHQITSSTETVCEVDRLLIGNVFRNLIENSLAASKDPVNITLSYVDTEVDGAPALTVTYEDSGPGMSDEQAQRAFEPFYTSKTHGTGLGLAICQQSVEAHGGTIELNCEPNSGAEFTIILPRHG